MEAVLQALLEEVKSDLDIAKQDKTNGRTHYTLQKIDAVGVKNYTSNKIKLHDTLMPVGYAKIPIDEAIAYFTGQKSLLMALLQTEESD